MYFALPLYLVSNGSNICEYKWICKYNRINELLVLWWFQREYKLINLSISFDFTGEIWRRFRSKFQFQLLNMGIRWPDKSFCSLVHFTQWMFYPLAPRKIHWKNHSVFSCPYFLKLNSPKLFIIHESVMSWKSFCILYDYIWTHLAP